MASAVTENGISAEKLSFAKIAAAGLKSASPQNNLVNPAASNQNNVQGESVITKPPSLSVNAKSAEAMVTAASKTRPHQVAIPLREPIASGTGGSEFLTQRANHVSLSGNKGIQGLTRGHLAAPASADDGGTQVSSSSDSIQPPSLDGKSIASGTTFALDEKESLRPDDSASVKAAAEDEDAFTPPSTGISGSRQGSDDGMRAFRQQLQEISSMDPHGRGLVPQAFPLSANVNDEVLFVPSPGPLIAAPGLPGRGIAEVVSVSAPLPDPKLLEALDSPRDRIWVLKLEQDIFDFVKDAKETSLNLPQCNAYHRMLAHKIADYYMLGHVVDDSVSAVRLFKTPNCRIPPPLTGITTPSTAATNTPPPSAPLMKILRRSETGSAIAAGSNLTSKTTSENGESGPEDEKKSKLPASREEREARYEAARLRIMGSAKPSESDEATKEAEESRPSSTTGKKPRKKQRSDSEDGFEARSAYSAYFTPPYGTSSYAPAPHNFSIFSDSPISSNPPGATFGGPDAVSAYPHYSTLPSSPGASPWSQSAYAPGPDVQHLQQWQQGPQQQNRQPQHPHHPHQHHPSEYDLSHEFNRSMSLQTPAAPGPFNQHSIPSPANTFPAQFYNENQQQGWMSQSQHPPPPHGHSSLHMNRPTSSSGPGYQYGQLPSQAFPGRAPSKLEHPLPGSYKSKHFNPNSQAFVPGGQQQQQQQQTPSTFRPLASAPSQPYSGFANYQNPTNSPSRSSQPPPQPHGYFGQHGGPSTSMNPYSMNQPMLHPLPQPVFPQQPSPNLPLPPKPPVMTTTTVKHDQTIPHSTSIGTSQSSIAKWGTPASLPAKPPPPSNELFETARYPSMSRTLSHSAAMRAPSVNGAYPAVLNGSAAQDVSRS